ncbi:MAG: histidine phosphatase family protein [Microthrixaceae bacterium]
MSTDPRRTDSAGSASPTAIAVAQAAYRPPKGATSVLLVRHGQTIPAVDGKPFPMVDGRGDPPLTELGRLQAEAVARRLAPLPLVGIVVTNLRRTSQSAGPLAAITGLTPLVEPDLTEYCFGEWEAGIMRLKIARRDPLAMRVVNEQRWDIIPGAERPEAFSERVAVGIERVADRFAGGLVAVFTHGGVVGEAMALASGGRAASFHGAANGSLSHLVVNPRSQSDDVAGPVEGQARRWVLRRFNATAHLPDDLDLDPVEA